MNIRSLFKSTPVVDPIVANSLTNTFLWMLEHFDQHFFENKTQLVLPIRDYFPDRASTELEMAQTLCKRILDYSGLSAWPFKLVPPNQFQSITPPLLDLTQLSLSHKYRGHELIENNSIQAESTQYESILEISYASAMMKKPMDLVASMSKFIAQHYLMQSRLTPPAGAESFNATSEILAIFMGFGVMIANTAYTFRGSCARCYDPRANRSAALSENEAIYCLALFAHYKKLDNKAVTPSLKPYLRSSFKKARKQVQAHGTKQLENS